MKPRSLHLAVYSDATSRAGAEISLGNLLAELGPHVQVTVMGTDPAVVQWLAARRPGSGTIILPTIRNRYDVASMWATRRAIRRLRPDIFQANLTTLASCQWAQVMASSIRDLRVIAVEHLPVGPLNSLARVLKRRTERRLAAHVAVGEQSAREVESRVGLRPGSVLTIYNGVPDVPPRAVRRLAEGPVVGTLSRLHPAKGLDLLIRAVAQLSGVTLVIAGEGPAHNELLGLARDLGVDDRLHLVGWSDAPRDLLAGVDVFALPSKAEALPLSILEAMLASLPVVATDVGSVREEVAEGETGFVIAPGDVDALTQALQCLLADPELRTRLGSKGRERAQETFTSTAMSRSYEALYDTVLSSRRAEVRA